MSAKARLLEIFDREEKVLVRRIELLSGGYMTTWTNNIEDTQESLALSIRSLEEIRRARELLNSGI